MIAIHERRYAVPCLLVLACAIAVCAQESALPSVDEVVPEVELLLEDANVAVKASASDELQAIRNLVAYAQEAYDSATDMDDSGASALIALIIALGKDQSPCTAQKVENHALQAKNIEKGLNDDQKNKLSKWDGQFMQLSDHVKGTATQQYHDALASVKKTYGKGVGDYLLKALTDSVENGKQLIVEIESGESESAATVVGFSYTILGLNTMPDYFAKLAVRQTKFTDRLACVINSDRVAEENEKAEKAAAKEKAEKEAERAVKEKAAKFKEAADKVVAEKKAKQIAAEKAEKKAEKAEKEDAEKKRVAAEKADKQAEKAAKAKQERADKAEEQAEKKEAAAKAAEKKAKAEEAAAAAEAKEKAAEKNMKEADVKNKEKVSKEEDEKSKAKEEAEKEAAREAKQKDEEAKAAAEQAEKDAQEKTEKADKAKEEAEKTQEKATKKESKVKAELKAAEEAAAESKEKADEAAQKKAEQKEQDEKAEEEAAEKTVEKADKAEKAAEKQAKAAAAQEARQKADEKDTKAREVSGKEAAQKEKVQKLPVYENCKCQVKMYKSADYYDRCQSSPTTTTYGYEWTPDSACRGDFNSVKISSGCDTVILIDDDDGSWGKHQQNIKITGNMPDVPYDLEDDVAGFYLYPKQDCCKSGSCMRL